MSDDTQDGGTDWELLQAENAIAASGTDTVALAKAQRRHADAIRNMMQGALVPSFVSLVERVIGEKITPVSEGIEGLRGDVRHLASESAARLGKLEQRMDESEEDRADLRRRLERIERILAERPAQREAEHQALLQAIANGVRHAE